MTNWNVARDAETQAMRRRMNLLLLVNLAGFVLLGLAIRWVRQGEAMDLLDHFSRMAANNRWSNDRLYRAVLALKPGEFEAPRTSFFPSIKETLNHILAVDLLYLDMLEEGGVGASVFDDFAPFDHAGNARTGAGGVRPQAARLLQASVIRRSRSPRHH